MEQTKFILGIDGGGTKTEWVYYKNDALLERGRLPASNMTWADDRTLENIFRQMPQEATDVGIFLAGCLTAEDRERLRNVAQPIWPNARLALGGDRQSGIAAALRDRPGVLVIAGTGSAILGQNGAQTARAEGWGHLLGDDAGGYGIALQGLRQMFANHDLTGETSPIMPKVLRALCLNRQDDLVGWIPHATKSEIGQLAPLICDAAENGDAEMREILHAAASRLGEKTVAVAKRLALDAPEIRLVGSMFSYHPEYVSFLAEPIRASLPNAHIEICKESSAVGAAWLASQGALSPANSEVAEESAVSETEALTLSPTEQPNPRSANLDRMSDLEMVDLFVREEAVVADAVAHCRQPIARAIVTVSDALKNGGRLFYIGAGTSGRLGVLDASEIPPTFGMPPDAVQGIIAGGFHALFQSVEGAEDHASEGAAAVRERGVGAGDVVCGIAASGRTPFVLGALEAARKPGAKTILISCNPAREKASPPWDVEIDLPTGAEIVTGSTRLKAGSATKLVLNIISTCSMVKLGRVTGNFMTHVETGNAKLRDRATRIVSQLARISYGDARKKLETNGWDVAKCVREKAPNY